MVNNNDSNYDCSLKYKNNIYIKMDFNQKHNEKYNYLIL